MSVRTRFLDEFSEAIEDHSAAVFVGAGISRAAGYPSWRELLRDIADELQVNIADIADLSALAQWSMRADAGRTNVLNAIRRQIAPEHPVPEALETLTRLPIRTFWTTNYDTLIERALRATGRPVDARFSEQSLALRNTPGAAQVYKMHGCITDPSNLVIATDDYELFRVTRGQYIPLLQAHLSSFTFLFCGMSLTDPNVRHVLALIRERFPNQPPQHFAIVRPPQSEEFNSHELWQAKLREHRYWADDLKRYGLQVVEISDYTEINNLVSTVEKRVASKRVWVSGSWPLDAPGSTDEAQKVHDLSYGLGRAIYQNGLTLISGYGLLVGSASLAGFIAAAQEAGDWDLANRLIARPFPQPVPDMLDPSEAWTRIREEMSRLAGSVVVVGGAKLEDNTLRVAQGVLDEVRLAAEHGANIIPIAATGYAADVIFRNMTTGKSRKPPKSLTALANRSTPTEDLVAEAIRAIKSGSR